MSYAPSVGPKGLEPSPAGLKVRCAAVTPRPQNAGRAYPFPSCVVHAIAPCSSGSPESRTQRHSVISRVWATGPRLPSLHAVGRAVLESRAPPHSGGRPGLQPGATPSQLPTQTKKARCLWDTRLWVFFGRYGLASQAQWIGRERIRRLIGECTRPSSRFVTQA